MDNNKYIFLNNNEKIYFCAKCVRYIIYIKGKEIFKCPICHYAFINNIFIDEAKIYFNPQRSDQRFIGNELIGIRYFSTKLYKGE